MTDAATAPTARAAPLPPAAGEAVLWAFAAYGLVFVALPDLARAWPFEAMFYAGARPAALEDPEADRALDFYAGLVGALTSGWFVTAALSLRSRERRAWNAALAGIAVWFIADSAASLATGFPQNVATNAGFAALGAGVLIATRPGIRRTV